MMKQSKSLYDRHWRKRRAEQLRLYPLCRLCADITVIAELRMPIEQGDGA